MAGLLVIFGIHLWLFLVIIVFFILTTGLIHKFVADHVNKHLNVTYIKMVKLLKIYNKSYIECIFIDDYIYNLDFQIKTSEENYFPSLNFLHGLLLN